MEWLLEIPREGFYGLLGLLGSSGFGVFGILVGNVFLVFFVCFVGLALCDGLLGVRFLLGCWAFFWEFLALMHHL